MAKNETTTTTEAKAPKAPKAQRFCTCLVRIPDYFGGTDEAGNTDEAHWVYDIGCGRTVGGRSVFAQGHDAKLKSELIKAFRAGVEISVIDGDMMITQSPMNLAAGHAWERFLTPAKAKAPRKAPKGDDEPFPRGTLVEVSYRSSKVQGRVQEVGEGNKAGFYVVEGKTNAGKKYSKVFKANEMLAV